MSDAQGSQQSSLTFVDCRRRKGQAVDAAPSPSIFLVELAACEVSLTRIDGDRPEGVQCRGSVGACARGVENGRK